MPRDKIEETSDLKEPVWDNLQIFGVTGTALVVLDYLGANRGGNYAENP